MTSRWLSGCPSTEARIRLFCIPHAGGGGSFFLPWKAELAPEVDVCPIVLPGREGRIRETPFQRMEPLLDDLAPALLPYADVPFVVFGHSMGSIVAYELARRLQTEHGASPSALIVSGRRAPHLPARRAPLHALPHDDFVAGLQILNGTPPEVLDDPAMLRLFLPTLRADFAVNETYHPSEGVVLSCPVSALTGTADPEVTIDEMAEWHAVSTGGFSLRVFHGDHFYLKSKTSSVVNAIRQDLLRIGRQEVAAGVAA